MNAGTSTAACVWVSTGAGCSTGACSATAGAGWAVCAGCSGWITDGGTWLTVCWFITWGAGTGARCYN